MRTLSSLQHPLIKRLTALRKERKMRQQEGSVVIEGKKLVRENVRLVRTLLTTSPSTEFSLPESAEVYAVSPEMIQKISGVKSPEGVLAEVKMPSFKLPARLQRLLVLENLNDPGNLGTLIRTSLAFGWDGVFLLGNCCDPFNDKAIRASKGAIFKLPIVVGDLESLKTLLIDHQMSVFIADLEGKKIGAIPKVSKMALVLGSEAHGPSEEVISIGERLTIPISSGLDSLNVAVAGGILLHYFQ
ncbi:uncharacterized tRNA/rRNA methyltransferase YsgA [Waddlia chondrophila 2032/99]|uniref:Uncharacterized tRNA/rRNA methyltransferase YsgA n=1 Tax=Waddlia chondrophila 2032/99 TaxID=765953 RepID=F8LB01_9BACT|nr:uncharacterized tRNA/rRNA methyltransferase YsgA [Waddlia chondrophila 2032/99]